MTNGIRILLSPPHVGPREREYLLKAFDSGWIAPAGPDLALFEEAVCEWTGTKHSVALASGTAGIHLGLLNLGVRPGDEVFVSTLTFAATANAVMMAGGVPTFIDSENSTMNMDPNLLEEALESRASAGRPLPKVVLCVDLYGQAAQYERIEAICKTYEIALFEDAAEGVGGSRDARRCGSFGKAAVVSFNGNKIATSGGGGALVSDDADFIARARYLSTQARQPVVHYEHTDIGYNYRLSNLLAAVGRAQLEWLQERIDRRKYINEFYRAALDGAPGVRVTEVDSRNVSNYWLSTIIIDSASAKVDRETVRLGLAANGIESRPIWKPMHLQPVYAAHEAFINGVSNQFFNRGLCLPSGSSMTNYDLELVAQRLRQSLL